MCNLSSVVLEEGIVKEQRRIIKKMIVAGKSAEEISYLCDIPIETVTKIENEIAVSE